MSKDKIGICLIILGNILYVAYVFFFNNESSPFGDFTSGVILGLSIGINLIGIILTVMAFSSKKKDD